MTESTARRATRVSTSDGSRVVTRCRASPGRRKVRATASSSIAWTSCHSSIVSARESIVTASGVHTSDGRGQHLGGGESDRRRERGEVRPAAKREAGGPAEPVPRLLQTPGFGSRDSPVLGPVERERPAAEEQEEQERRSARSRPRARRARRGGRGRTGGAVRPRGRAAPEPRVAPPRRMTGANARASFARPTKERRPPHEARQARHAAFDQRPVDAGEGPVRLADDHDAVGAGHAAQARQHRRKIRLTQSLPHRRSFADGGPPGNGPGGLFQRRFGPTSTRARRSRAERARG